MTFVEYQEFAKRTAVYPEVGAGFVYPALGLCGEAGEVAEKIKKIFRDRSGIVDDEVRATIAKELGDCLWYIAQIATELGLSLEEIARQNIEKLIDRKARGRLHGDGDER